ncbi:MAG: glycosyltransferase family 2 protein [Aeromonas sp.]
MRDLISVLMPVYNVAPFVEEALLSLLPKATDPFDVEIIVVDDGSSDATYARCCALSARYPLIRVFKNETNLKICQTLNRALREAKGNYIARHDGDDIALAGKLLAQWQHLTAHNIDLVGCQILSINEQGEPISRAKMPVGVTQVLRSSAYASPIAHSWLAKRAVYTQLNGYRDIPYAEDFDFLLRAFEAGFRCDNLADVYVAMRQRIGNTASTASLIQRKTHDYVLALRAMRQAQGMDNFSAQALADATSSHPWYARSHAYSTHLLTSAFHDKKRWRKGLKVLGCCLLSWHNLRYLISRVQFRRSFDAAGDK